MVRRPRPSLSEKLLAGRSVGDAIDEELGHLRAGPFDEDAFPSRLHDERVAALLGIALGVAFATCFLTGLYSHFAQTPLSIGFLSMPASPAWLYRVTQGLHVASGTAAIPLLLVKLWVVYPQLFAWPPVRDLPHALTRLSLAPLIAGSIFLLFTGLLNTARWYPWEFGFRETHYWVAWVTVGSLLVHVGAQLVVLRRTVGPTARRRLAVEAPEPPGDGLSRRGLLTATAAAVGAVTLATVGQTVRPLKDLSVLAPRLPDVGPQGLPVNRSAAGAGVLDLIRDPEYRLTVTGAVERELSLTLAELQALPQHDADLAITCVEGWSAGATWSGVRVRELLELAGASPDAEVRVRSLQRRGSFRSSELNVPHAQHPDTLLALRIDGEELHPDHGFPCRLISPNRPGVQQTKWVTRLEVL
ncbi:molybdopterin-dependent oxidoreductase [Conexibacter sp. W3-3-2]|uniref:molybdopterin-dependent oxidoreductase n=1 Tax=Conexibacter sp. W3-3-2 TaxID=2675227 RepID=UPI0012B7B04E|nr:molybdopterin-dependent oxidoreductase [Conexibacter sp. W3-3-2]MTD42965.1 molybdopterin-dependent oxidoreductase [Conexibacter sp. W3-3-2]